VVAEHMYIALKQVVNQAYHIDQLEAIFEAGGDV
jgi:hypothetical protein